MSSFELVTLNSDHKEEICDLNSKAKKEKGHFIPGNEEMIEACLISGETSFGIFSDNKLAAFLLCGFPEDLGYSYGSKIGITGRHANYAGSIVDPLYSGRGFNSCLKIHASIEFSKRPDCQFAIGICSPFNIPSVKANISSGAIIFGLVNLDNGDLRYVYIYDLKRSVSFCNKLFDIDAKSIDEQRELLEKGYVSNYFYGRGDDWRICYRELYNRRSL